MDQTGSKARQGDAVIWSPWYRQDSNGSSNWKDVERKGPKGTLCMHWPCILNTSQRYFNVMCLSRDCESIIGFNAEG